MFQFRVENTTESIRFWSVISIASGVAFACLFRASELLYIRLGAEDAIVENLSALFYAIGGAILVWSGILGKNRRSRGLLTVMLGLFFLFVAGEEISWGQRLFGIETPDSVASMNTQSELNFHNLELFDRNSGFFSQHTLLNVFVLVNGVILPLLFHLSSAARNFLSRLRFPIAPLCSMPIFIMGLIYGQSVAKFWPHWAHTEYKELFFSLGFLLVGVAILKGTNVGQAAITRGRIIFS